MRPLETDRVGRLTGRRVLDLRFRVPFGTLVSIGEILVGTEDGTERTFLLRVVDVEHGQESADDEWTERVAGSMLRLDDRREPYDLHDRNHRLYQVASAVPLGYIVTDASSEQRLRRPKSLPWHFARLRRVTKEDLAFIESYDQALEVGHLRSGGTSIPYPVGIPSSLLCHHIGVFATTGMGKSNLMKTLAARILSEGRHGMLLLDPHGEYYDGGAGSLRDGRPLRGLRDAAGAEERLAVYSTRPLSGPYNRLRISAYEITLPDVLQLFRFSPAQLDALYAARGAFGPAWLVELAERHVDELVAEFGNRVMDVTFSVLKRRAERILGFDAVHSDPTVSVTESVVEELRAAKVVLVDASSLGEAEEILASSVLARAVFSRNKRLYKEREAFEKMPPCIIALEEAQRVLAGRDGDPGVFAQIAREGRKFKTGLLAVTQQPKLIPEQLLSQFNTFVILGLADERDRAILSGSSKQPLGPMLTEIQTLEPGEAVIASPAVPFAVPATIHLYEDVLESIQLRPEALVAASANGFY